MIKQLTVQHMKEYGTIASLLSLVFLFGLLSLLNVTDMFLIITAAGSVVGMLLLLNRVEPVHLFYALCLGVSFLPYINLEMFPLAGTYVMALIFLVFFGFWKLKSGEQILFSPQAKWMAALLGVGLVSLAVAPDKRSAIIYGGQFFLYICVYIAVSNTLRSKAEIIKSLRYIIYGSIVTLGISLVQLLLSMIFSIGRVVDVFFGSIIGELFIGSRGLERIGDSAAILLNRGSNLAESADLTLFRVFGTFEGPTIFGWYLLVIGLLAGGLYLGQYAKRRVAFTGSGNALLFLIAVFFLVLTWTRSALLSFLIALAFIFMYRKRRPVKFLTPKVWRFFLIVTGTAMVAGILLWLFRVSLSVADLIKLLGINQLGGSSIGRLLTILFAVNYIAENPLMGIGMGNYKYVQPRVDADGEASFASAHNTYLELGVELGLSGLIIFVMLLRSFIQQAMVLTRASLSSFYHTLGITFLAIWIGFAFVSFFGGNLIHPRFMTLLWILAGIQTASYQLYIHEKKKEHTVYRLEAAD